MIRNLILAVILTFVVIFVLRWLRSFEQWNEFNRRAEKTEDTEKRHAAVLELDSEVTPDAVKRGYRELMSKYHPDKVQHLGAEFQKMAELKTKEINQAYEYFGRKFGF